MTEVSRIQEQLRRAMQGDAWHGESLREILKDIDAETASAKPAAAVHSIWELTLHVAAWLEAVSERLDGRPAGLIDDENFPPVRDRSDAAWRQAQARLNDGYTRLDAKLNAVPDARLETSIVEGKASTYITLHGAVQHLVYHAGQIALLKKWHRSKTT